MAETVGNETTYTGIDVDLLITLATHLNFRYTLKTSAL